MVYVADHLGDCAGRDVRVLKKGPLVRGRAESGDFGRLNSLVVCAAGRYVAMRTETATSGDSLRPLRHRAHDGVMECPGRAAQALAR